MDRVRNWKRLAASLILVVLVAACSESGAAAPQGVNTGNVARDFTLETVEGNSVSLKDHRGQVVLINFWATWCPPCRAEIPDLQSTYLERREDGFVVLGVNVEEPLAEVQQFMDEMEMTYPVLLDEGGQVLQTYRANGLPMSVIVDSEGVIQVRHVGYLTASQLEDYLAELIP
jgi:peroxiredoxin